MKLNYSCCTVVVSATGIFPTRRLTVVRTEGPHMRTLFSPELLLLPSLALLLKLLPSYAGIETVATSLLGDVALHSPQGKPCVLCTKQMIQQPIPKVAPIPVRQTIGGTGSVKDKLLTTTAEGNAVAQQ